MAVWRRGMAANQVWVQTSGNNDPSKRLVEADRVPFVGAGIR